MEARRRCFSAPGMLRISPLLYGERRAAVCDIAHTANFPVGFASPCTVYMLRGGVTFRLYSLTQGGVTNVTNGSRDVEF